MLRRSGAFDRKQMLLFTQIDERDKRYEMGKRFAKLVTSACDSKFINYSEVIKTGSKCYFGIWLE